MKKLSDYKGEEAIELWADLLEPLSIIFSDKAVRDSATGSSYVKLAQSVLKAHAKEATEILLRVDDTPIDGLNIMLRLVGIFSEIGESEYGQSFFGYAEQDEKK